GRSHGQTNPRGSVDLVRNASHQPPKRGEFFRLDQRTDDITSLVADRQSTRQKPAVGAVPTAQGECVFPGHAGFEALPDALHHAVDMLGMVLSWSPSSSARVSLASIQASLKSL